MKDFSHLVFHCSQLLYLMRDGREKSPMVLWEEAVDLLADREVKYLKLKDKTTEGAHNRLLKIATLRQKVSELELNKDEEILSESGKAQLVRLYGWHKYHKWTLSGEEGYYPIEKGLALEQSAIELISELDNHPYRKNTQRFTNNFITGEPDIIVDDYVIDVKCSWDLTTFLNQLYRPLPKMYWWQMQGYLSLTGATKGEVSFCLLSNPEDVIREEIHKKKLLERYPKTIEWLINKFTYDDIPIQERRIKFLVERDDEAISKIPKRVMKGREFLIFLQNTHTEPRLATSDL